MINGKQVLAVIPARGGSKRLPGKNIANFNKLPLIAWTILAARCLRYIDRLICSTDSLEIAKVCKEYDCNVLMRPAELATDTSTTADAVLHALDIDDHQQTTIDMNGRPDLVVVLQPTSPLRTAADIDCGIALGMSVSVGPDGKTNGAVYVVEAELFRKHPYFGGRVFYMPKERSVDIDTREDFIAALNEAHCSGVTSTVSVKEWWMNV